MVYTNNVPQGSQTIAQTTDPIRDNFAFIQSAINQEHNFSAADPTVTYHLRASMPNSTPVGLPAGTNGMYYVEGGEAKFRNNSGNISQLTLGLPVTNGYQWIGRVLLQWGFSNATPNPGSVNFPIPFSASPYTLQLTSQRGGGSSITANWVSVSSTQFNYQVSGGTSTGFYWLAVGSA